MRKQIYLVILLISSFNFSSLAQFEKDYTPLKIESSIPSEFLNSPVDYINKNLELVKKMTK